MQYTFGIHFAIHKYQMNNININMYTVIQYSSIQFYGEKIKKSFVGRAIIIVYGTHTVHF